MIWIGISPNPPIFSISSQKLHYVPKRNPHSNIYSFNKFIGAFTRLAAPRPVTLSIVFIVGPPCESMGFDLIYGLSKVISYASNKSWTLCMKAQHFSMVCPGEFAWYLHLVLASYLGGSAPTGGVRGLSSAKDAFTMCCNNWLCDMGRWSNFLRGLSKMFYYCSRGITNGCCALGCDSTSLISPSFFFEKLGTCLFEL